MNRSKSGFFETFLLCSWVFWYLTFSSVLHKTEGRRPGLVGKCMCALACDTKDLHSIVLPEPDSPTRSAGWWTSSSMSRRYACLSYCNKHKKYRHSSNTSYCWTRKKSIILMLYVFYNRKAKPEARMWRRAVDSYECYSQWNWLCLSFRHWIQRNAQILCLLKESQLHNSSYTRPRVQKDQNAASAYDRNVYVTNT